MTLGATCRDAADIIVDDAFCDALLRPNGQILCPPTFPCVYIWEEVGHTPCDDTCGLPPLAPDPPLGAAFTCGLPEGAAVDAGGVVGVVSVFGDASDDVSGLNLGPGSGATGDVVDPSGDLAYWRESP